MATKQNTTSHQADRPMLDERYLDEDQVGEVNGYSDPLDDDGLGVNGQLPKAMVDRLPPAEDDADDVVPCLEQQNARKEASTEQWDAVVGASGK
ncbi:hypothetical protein C3F00_043255 [Pseudomonas sp. MWU13-2860]|nr:hypothetical protein C3F00_043255 [Pseudomonas sp. MWU13-2860]